MGRSEAALLEGGTGACLLAFLVGDVRSSSSSTGLRFEVMTFPVSEALVLSMYDIEASHAGVKLNNFVSQWKGSSDSSIFDLSMSDVENSEKNEPIVVQSKGKFYLEIFFCFSGDLEGVGVEWATTILSDGIVVVNIGCHFSILPIQFIIVLWDILK